MIYRINPPVSTTTFQVSTKTASYVLSGSDANSKIIMNSSSSTEITVNDGVFAANDVVWIDNVGSGVCTITSGTATVVSKYSLNLFEGSSCLLFFISSSSCVLLNSFEKGIDCDFLVVGGGAAGGAASLTQTYGPGGGGAGGFRSSFDSTRLSYTQVGTTLSTGVTNDYFGYGTSLSSDGTVLAVGAPDADIGGTDRGFVRIYEWSGSDWVQMGSDIVGSVDNDRFGRSVKLSGDGSRVIIGATTNGISAGYIEVYDWSGSAWVQVGSRINGDTAGDYFGESVDISSNGSRIFIGAYGANLVKVYDWSGSAWVQVGSSILGLSGGFGYALSCTPDGSRFIAGAAGKNSNSGSVSVFSWTGSTWSLLGSEILGNSGEYFGEGVDISSNGSRIIAGGIGPTPGLNGVIRVYDWSGSSWVQVGSTVTGYVSAYRGTLVNLSSNETTFAAFSPNSSFTINNGFGQIDFYKYESGDWRRLDTIFPAYFKPCFSSDLSVAVIPSKRSFDFRDVDTYNVSFTNSSGGGGPVEQSFRPTLYFPYPIVVGAGGAGDSGNLSWFGNIISYGGGRGGQYLDANGYNGGSGGGSFYLGVGGSGVVNQGFDGGTSLSSLDGGGGGGGVGNDGFDAYTSGGYGGNGGAGVISSVGPQVVYAGGGGGGAYSSGKGGIGGSDVGGTGGSNTIGGTDGLIRTGSGGGGGSVNSLLTGVYAPGNGASGVVVFRVKDTVNVTFSEGVSYNVTNSGGYDTYEVTATSTFNETVVFS